MNDWKELRRRCALSHRHCPLVIQCDSDATTSTTITTQHRAYYYLDHYYNYLDHLYSKPLSINIFTSFPTRTMSLPSVRCHGWRNALLDEEGARKAA